MLLRLVIKYMTNIGLHDQEADLIKCNKLERPRLALKT